MKTYNLKNSAQRNEFKAACNRAAKMGLIVVFEEVKETRSLSLNNYYQFCIKYFASQYGDTAQAVKDEIFKKLCNKETFIQRDGSLKSTKDLDSREFSLCIERFKNYAAMKCGICIPNTDDNAAMQEAKNEIKKNKEFL